jgi:hypothetical protein
MERLFVHKLGLGYYSNIEPIQGLPIQNEKIL